MRFTQWRWAAAALTLVAVLAVAACGEGEAKDNVDVADSGPGVAATPRNFTPISNATPAPSATPGAAGAGGGATGRPVQVVAKDNVFEQRTLTIPRGEAVTLTMQNQGSAVHNWHLQGVAGEPKTDLIPGGQTARVTFTVNQAGTFTYLCDVHPTEMTGRLTAE